MPTVEVRINLPEELRAIASEVNDLEQKAAQLTADLHAKIRELPQLIGAQNLVGPSYGGRAMVRVSDFSVFEAVVSLAFHHEQDAAPASKAERKRDELQRMLQNTPEKIVNAILNNLATKDERRAIIGIMFPGLWEAVAPPQLVPLEEPPEQPPARPTTYHELDYAEPAQEPVPAYGPTDF